MYIHVHVHDKEDKAMIYIHPGQLSKKKLPWVGFEPMTYCVLGKCSYIEKTFYYTSSKCIVHVHVHPGQLSTAMGGIQTHDILRSQQVLYQLCIYTCTIDAWAFKGTATGYVSYVPQ